MKGGQSASQPVLVSTAVSDPSADWDLIELDDEEEEGDGTEETGNGKNESFQDAEHRLIGTGFSFNLVKKYLDLCRA